MKDERHVTLRRCGLDDLDGVRALLVDTYLEVYAAGRRDPYFSRERFVERLVDHAGPGWEAVVGYAGEEAVGYAYGCPLPADTVWWSRAIPELPAAFTAEDGRRTWALLELMVHEPWRGTGTAHRLHDELLGPRAEERVTLLVEQDRARVRALYERWGYRRVAAARPEPDAPRYDLMVRSLEPYTPSSAAKPTPHKRSRSTDE